MGAPVRTLRAAASVVALTATLCVLVSPSPASACDNDRDLRRMEERFPDVRAVLAGKYIRHSETWMAWRAKDRQARLDRDLDPESGNRRPPATDGERAERLRTLDDLSVANDKIGRHEEAIAAAREALEADPARYESLANLGTALAHAGRLDEGIPLLRKALGVNPDAHFGRERYEIAYFEWVASRSPGGAAALPLFRAGAEGPSGVGFAAFLAARRTPAGETVVPLTGDERAAAAKGVVGLMFSTRHDDPSLCEALAHLLVDPNRSWVGSVEARRDAARAYLAAALAAPTPEAAASYRESAQTALSTGEADDARLSLEDVEDEFNAERAAGDAYTKKLFRDEKAYLASTPNPEAAFAARYLESGVGNIQVRERSDERVARAARPGASGGSRVASALATPSAVVITKSTREPLPTALVLGVAGLIVAAGAVLFVTRGPRRRPVVRRRPRRPIVVAHAARRGNVVSLG